MAHSRNAPIAGIPADGDILRPTLDAVRTNCHISDARYATEYTLCVYLLKMREYFRWEHGLPFGASLPQAELSDWLSAREAHWEQLEQDEFLPVPVHDRLYDPFDAASVNLALNPLGYVYSSGYGRGMKPVFFLGKLEQHRQLDQYTLLVSGTELARDLAAPPAMSLDNTIFIRRESLRRMLWERLEEWRWNRPDNAMKTALEFYDFENEPDAALETMTDTELNSLVLHEIGEVKAGALLGPGWETLLASLGHSRLEIMLRALRDHLADALSTLPALLDQAKPAALHFYFSNLTSMRKDLSPGLLAAYEIWKITGSTHELKQVARRATTHWSDLAVHIVRRFEAEGADCIADLAGLIEAHALQPDHRDRSR